MSPDPPELERKYRQPRVFGALPDPGPRNVPLDKRNMPDNMSVVTVAASAFWEDVPLQHPIINALAESSLKEFRGASVSFAMATGSIGGGFGGARPVR
jgi:hypothetical protein